MSADDISKRERERAVRLMKQRYFDAFEQVARDDDEIDKRLTDAINAAERAILSEDVPAELSSDHGAEQNERERATRIMTKTFFDAVELASEVDDVDEQLTDAISGAERDILGEYAPAELFNDPGALIEAVKNLGITTESRHVTGGPESRWFCATCRKHGAWTPNRSMLEERLDHEHAASHTVRTAS